MRFRLRLMLVSATFFALAVGLFVSDGPTLLPASHPVAAGIGTSGTAGGSTEITGSGIDDGTDAPPAPQPRETGGDRAPAHSTPHRVAPRARARAHDAVLIAARLNPGAIEAGDLRRFWMEAVDRGAPDEAIDVLLGVARANTARGTIAHAALDYRDDLLELRRARQMSEAPRIAPSPEPPRSLLDAEWRDELADVIRFGSEPREVSRAIALMTLDRSASASRALLDGVDHPGADQRLSALTALWRAAADGTADREQVRDAWDRARFDPDPVIAARAASVVGDLDRLAKADAGAHGLPDGAATATALPMQVGADPGDAS